MLTKFCFDLSEKSSATKDSFAAQLDAIDDVNLSSLGKFDTKLIAADSNKECNIRQLKKDEILFSPPQ